MCKVDGNLYERMCCKVRRKLSKSCENYLVIDHRWQFTFITAVKVVMVFSLLISRSVILDMMLNLASDKCNLCSVMNCYCWLCCNLYVFFRLINQHFTADVNTQSSVGMFHFHHWCGLTLWVCDKTNLRPAYLIIVLILWLCSSIYIRLQMLLLSVKTAYELPNSHQLNCFIH